MEKKLRTLLITLVSAIIILLPINAHAAGVVEPSVSYQGHVQNIGWQNWVGDGQEAGTDGKSFRVEALKIKLVNAPAGANIKYQAHVQNVGWQNWVSNGQEAGTDARSLRVEAIKITLENMPGYSIQYQAHVQNVGWQNWVSNGQEAGTDGRSLRVEAIRIRIVANNTVNSFPLLSDVPMPANINYYKTSSLDQPDGTYIFYCYDGSTLPSNFFADYYKLLEDNGWILYSSEPYNGVKFDSFVKDNNMVSITLIEDDIVIFGLNH